MEGDSWEKFSVFLVVIGLVTGALGAVLAFWIAVWMMAFFYLGFFTAILGFAIAVLHRVGESKK